MAINLINTGVQPNDGTGDSLRVGATKVNESITQLQSILDASVVPPQLGNAGKLLSTNGSTLVWIDGISSLQADWLSTSGPSQILNKPTLASVAISGNYFDLTNRPTIPSNNNQLINGADFAVRSEINWNTLAGRPTLATVAVSGSYLDLTDKPTLVIPTQSNNSGKYLTTDGTTLSWATISSGGTPGTPGVGVPAGGTQGQVLAKINSVDYNTQWVDQTSGSGTYTLPTASTTELGGVKVDGTTIIINNGVISSIGGGTVTGSTVAISGIAYPNGASAASTAGGEIITLTGIGFQPGFTVYKQTDAGYVLAGVNFQYVDQATVRFTTVLSPTQGEAIVTPLKLTNITGTSADLFPGMVVADPTDLRFNDPNGLLAIYSRNTAVSKTLSVTGGTAPYAFTLISGSLPTGLTLNISTGVISGTTADVSYDTGYTFEVNCHDSAGLQKNAYATFTILVKIPVPWAFTIGGDTTIGGSRLVSNNAYFIQYVEGIVNAPTITISSSPLISNNEYFIQYIEGIVNTPTFTITGTAITSYTNTTAPLTQRAIFAFGAVTTGIGNIVSTTNLVSATGIVSTDTTSVASGRYNPVGATYGGDKAIFGFGINSNGSYTSSTNLVSNAGVIGTDVTGVGTARYNMGASGYGADKAIIGFGSNPSTVSMTNLVSNTGVVATDTTGVGTARTAKAARYGGDKAIFGFGNTASSTDTSVTNLVSNTGVVATDTAGVGSARNDLDAAGYGGDKAIFGYGYTNPSYLSISNLVSNTGVVATNTSIVGTARTSYAASSYGGDKAIFGFGAIASTFYSITNLVSNTGVVASDTTGVGTARTGLAAAGYSLT